MIKIAQSTKLALSCFYIIISTLFIILHIKFYIKKQNILNFPFSTFSVIYQLYLFSLLIYLRDKITHLREFQMQDSSVQSLSYVRSFATPWATLCQASLSVNNSWRSLLKSRYVALNSVAMFSRWPCFPLAPSSQ